MALLRYYRCKRCDSNIAYGPLRPVGELDPFLLCRSCIGQGEQLLAAAAHALRSYQHGNDSPDLARMVADSIDVAFGPKLGPRERWRDESEP